MAAGLAAPQLSSEAWPAMGFQAEGALNTGWILDQKVDGAGGFLTNATPSSSSTYFFSTGDATGLYLPGRRFQCVQSATVYGDIVSSSCDASATNTRVTVGKFVSSTGLSTGAITSIAVSPDFPSTGGGAGNELYTFGTQLMIRSWGG